MRDIFCQVSITSDVFRANNKEAHRNTARLLDGPYCISAPAMLEPHNAGNAKMLEVPYTYCLNVLYVLVLLLCAFDLLREMDRLIRITINYAREAGSKRPAPIFFYRRARSINAAKLARWGLNVCAHLGSMKRCLLYTSPSPRDRQKSRMPSSA